MTITLKFPHAASVARYVDALLETVAVSSQLTLTIELTRSGGYYVVSVTEGSSSTSLPTGSEPQQTTLKNPRCRGCREGYSCDMCD